MDSTKEVGGRFKFMIGTNIQIIFNHFLAQYSAFMSMILKYDESVLSALMKVFMSHEFLPLHWLVSTKLSFMNTFTKGFIGLSDSESSITKVEEGPIGR